MASIFMLVAWIVAYYANIVVRPGRIVICHCGAMSTDVNAYYESRCRPRLKAPLRGKQLMLSCSRTVPWTLTVARQELPLFEIMGCPQHAGYDMVVRLEITLKATELLKRCKSQLRNMMPMVIVIRALLQSP